MADETSSNQLDSRMRKLGLRVYKCSMQREELGLGYEQGQTLSKTQTASSSTSEFAAPRTSSLSVGFPSRNTLSAGLALLSPSFSNTASHSISSSSSSKRSGSSHYAPSSRTSVSGGCESSEYGQKPLAKYESHKTRLERRVVNGKKQLVFVQKARPSASAILVTDKICSSLGDTKLSATEAAQTLRIPSIGWMESYLDNEALSPTTFNMLSTIGDFLFEAGCYLQAFEHYYSLYGHLSKSTINNLDLRLRIAYACGRSYTTPAQSEKAKEVLEFTIAQVDIHNGKSKRECSLLSTFLGEMSTEAKGKEIWSHLRKAIIMLFTPHEARRFLRPTDPIPYETMESTARLFKLSNLLDQEELERNDKLDLGLLGVRDMYSVVQEFIRRAVPGFTSDLLTWCKNAVEAEAWIQDEHLVEDFYTPSRSKVLRTVYFRLLRSWLSDAARKGYSYGCTHSDILVNFRSPEWSWLPEYNALSAVVRMILERCMPQRQSGTANDRAMRVRTHVLATIGHFLGNGYEAERKLGDLLVSTFETTMDDRQGDYSFSDAELSSLIVEPLVSSEHLRDYIIKRIVSYTEYHQRDDSAATKHVQFSHSDADSDIIVVDRSPEPSFAPSLHSSSNSSYARFKKTGTQQQQQQQQPRYTRSANSRSSGSTNAMSIDSSQHSVPRERRRPVSRASQQNEHSSNRVEARDFAQHAPNAFSSAPDVTETLPIRSTGRPPPVVHQQGPARPTERGYSPPMRDRERDRPRYGPGGSQPVFEGGGADTDEEHKKEEMLRRRRERILHRERDVLARERSLERAELWDSRRDRILYRYP